MKKTLKLFVFILAMMLIISACAGNNEEQNLNDDVNEPGISDELGEVDGNKDDIIDENGNDEDVTEEDGNDEAGLEDEGEVSGTKLEQMVSTILETVEQRATMPLEEDMIKDMYYIDPAMIDEFAIHLPMFNISTNEFAIIKVKDTNDIPAIEEGITQRATDVQISFEQYLPDQYENAKNFKIVVEEDYVLFVIDNEQTASEIIDVFQSFFEA